MDKPTQADLMKAWRQMAPDQAAMWDGGWAYQAGDFKRALELLEHALALNRDSGRPDISSQVQPMLEACRAKLQGRRAPGEVPDTCAFCGKPAELTRVLPDPFIFICDACLPVCEQQTTDLRASGQLAKTRFPPKKPVAEMCSFCGIGPRIMLALAGGIRRPICYECVEDFGEAVQHAAAPPD